VDMAPKSSNAEESYDLKSFWLSRR